MTEWIVIPNWEKFQHRADRSLPWLKLYIELEGRDDWRQLSLAARGLLVCIWIEYRRSKGQLRTSDIPGRVAQKVPRKTLDSLVQAGFVQLSPHSPGEVSAHQNREEQKRVDKKEQKEQPAHFKTPDILDDVAPDDVTRFASKLRDSDKGTEHVLRKLRRDAPFAVFGSAYQALETRRKKSPPLTSETRYFVATVQKLTDEWKREAYL